MKEILTLLYCLVCKYHTPHALTQNGKEWVCSCGATIPVLEVAHDNG